MIGHLLNTTVVVKRVVTVADEAGGQSTSLTTIATLPARLSQPTGVSDRNEGAASGADITHVAYLAAAADVRRGDELHHGGQVLEVRAVYQPSLPAYLRADCTARQREGTP